MEDNEINAGTILILTELYGDEYDLAGLKITEEQKKNLREQGITPLVLSLFREEVLSMELERFEKKLTVCNTKKNKKQNWDKKKFYEK